MPVPEVEGLLSRAQVQETIDSIAEWQLPSGMVPWFPGGHADPWNHVEAAMALALGDRRAEAERAYQWLVDTQRPDGSWHQYYVADSVEQDKLDANVIAYVAAGVWHHWLLFGDRGFIEALWPVVERAVEFVLDLQTPRGEILWACSPGPRRSATRCAAPSPWPSCWATSGPTGSWPPPVWSMSSASTAWASCPTPSPPSTGGRWTGTTPS
jgi:hypothetical protein